MSFRYSRPKRQIYSGFTLIELVTALGLISILSLFLYKTYNEHFILKRVEATLEKSQRIVNAAPLIYYNVSNPDEQDEEYRFKEFSDGSIKRLKGLKVNLITPMDGITYQGTTVSSSYNLKVESNHLVSATFLLPGTEWKIENALLVETDTIGNGDPDAVSVTVYSRAQEETFLDLTGISRTIKKQIYFQEVR